MNRVSLCLSFCLLLVLTSALPHCAPFLCQTDSECKAAFPERPLCHYAKCKECITDRDCAGKRCVEGACSGAGEGTSGDLPTGESVADNALPDQAAGDTPGKRPDAPDQRLPSDKQPPDKEPLPDRALPSDTTPDATPDARPDAVIPPDGGGCSRKCSSGSHCNNCGTFTACINGVCGRPGNQCPPSSACTEDADCLACGKTTVCVGTRCIEPLCPTSCSAKSNCATCSGKNKSCLDDFDCINNPGTCTRSCGDPTCNPGNCTSDSECKGCTDGKIYCGEYPTGGSMDSCTDLRCPDSCISDKDCTRCTNGNICDGGNCDGWIPCQTDTDCKARVNVGLVNPFCQGGDCLRCRNDADCTQPSQPKCSPAKDRCVVCTSDADCTKPGLTRCNKNKNQFRCVACLVDTDCGTNQFCHTSSFVCRHKEGAKCDPADKVLRCGVGDCIRLSQFHHEDSFCIKKCSTSRPQDCSTGFTCVQTGASTVGGHCLIAGCSTDTNCTKLPGFACNLQSDKKGRVCGPTPKQIGTTTFGSTCDASAPCESGLLCVTPSLTSGNGICSKACKSNSQCSKNSSGKSSDCESQRGDFGFCLFPCTSDANCSQGHRCVSRYCFP